MSRPVATAAVLRRVVWRLLWHELLLWACLFRWIARRPHGVRPVDTAAAYTAAQATTVYGMLFVSVV